MSVYLSFNLAAPRKLGQDLAQFAKVAQNWIKNIRRNFLLTLTNIETRYTERKWMNTFSAFMFLKFVLSFKSTSQYGSVWNSVVNIYNLLSLESLTDLNKIEIQKTLFHCSKIKISENLIFLSMKKLDNK